MHLDPLERDEKPKTDEDEDLDALGAKRPNKGGGKGDKKNKGGGKGDKKKGDGKDGKGRSDGDKSNQCPICRRTGHDESKCWSNPKSPTFKGADYRKKTLAQIKALEEGEEEEGEEEGDDAQGLWLEDLCPLECGLCSEEDSSESEAEIEKPNRWKTVGKKTVQCKKMFKSDALAPELFSAHNPQFFSMKKRIRCRQQTHGRDQRRTQGYQFRQVGSHQRQTRQRHSWNDWTGS